MENELSPDDGFRYGILTTLFSADGTMHWVNTHIAMDCCKRYSQAVKILERKCPPFVYKN